MALFPSSSRAEYNGAVGKTHTNLVVSDGNAPSEQFLVSRTNEFETFVYEYGPEGNQLVQISKGKIVEAVGSEFNRETRHYETAIKVATAGTAKAIGVNQHNVYEQTRAGMDGNRPTVLQSQYIEVPLFEHSDVSLADESAQAMKFGAAYGQSGELQPGDYVMAGNDGNFVKWDESNFATVVGQVLNTTRELPPSGLLQYYTGLTAGELDAYLEQSGNVPGASDSIKPYGTPYGVGAWKPDFVKGLANGELKGIPFLTDGYFSAKKAIDVTLEDDEAVTTGLNEKVEAVNAGDDVEVNGGTITVGDVNESMVAIKLAHKIDPREAHGVKVTVTEGENTFDLSARDIHVDEKNNTIVLYVDGNTTYSDVKLVVPAVVDPVAGIPTEWDYAGSVGAARIKLLK